MISINGTGLNDGIAEGPIFIYNREEECLCDEDEYIAYNDINNELVRFDAALAMAKEQLHMLTTNKGTSSSKDVSDIMKAQAMILEDPEYKALVINDITNSSHSALKALVNAKDIMGQIFEATGDEYVNARVTDIEDITNRLIRIIRGNDIEASNIPKNPSILMASDISPSEFLGIDRKLVLGLVLTNGNEYGHTIILAKGMGIPVVIKANISDFVDAKLDGEWAILDGSIGRLMISPDEEIKATYLQKQNEEKALGNELKILSSKASVTKSGREILLYANINDVDEIEDVIVANAGGIGLYRSEFLYLKARSYPSEKQLFENYKTVVERMSGKRVIIRTLDVGYDKWAEYMDKKPGINPELSVRGIRFCLENRDIFKTQLKALYRASAYGKLAIMFPMINSVHELIEAKAICNDVARELADEGTLYDTKLSIGIMIETPDAVKKASELAGMVDFFSIGTNDLTKYAMAMEPNQEYELDEDDNDTKYQSVLCMIKKVIDAGHEAGIWVGICGEMAADINITGKLIELGVDEFSVPPVKVPKIRLAISKANM